MRIFRIVPNCVADTQALQTATRSDKAPLRAPHRSLKEVSKFIDQPAVWGFCHPATRDCQSSLLPAAPCSVRGAGRWRKKRRRVGSSLPFRISPIASIERLLPEATRHCNMFGSMFNIHGHVFGAAAGGGGGRAATK